MRFRTYIAATLLVTGLLACHPVRACGFGEAPGDCGQTPEGEARYMLLRVTNALKVDRTKALEAFQHGTAGFRTQDTYVFCVGPDGVMTAHPSPLLQGHDVRDLHDTTGNYFIDTMMKTAQAGKVISIRYLFPRPGSNVAVPKTTYYTRAGDQVCGVGVYDGDEGPAQAAPASRQDRITALRALLSAGMPAAMDADWTEFQRLLDDRTQAEKTAIAKAKEQIEAAVTEIR